MDVHVPGPITSGLLRRGVTVLRAQDDGMDEKDDPVLLDRALALGYVIFTQDRDFLAEAAHRQRTGQVFAGVVYARQQIVPYRICIDDLELLAKVYDPADMMNRLVYLPI
jgi:predicted nuclease of predicted toxin-antitoxin system